MKKNQSRANCGPQDAEIRQKIIKFQCKVMINERGIVKI